MGFGCVYSIHACTVLMCFRHLLVNTANLKRREDVQNICQPDAKVVIFTWKCVDTLCEDTLSVNIGPVISVSGCAVANLQASTKK